jgi:hypothetical protein
MANRAVWVLAAVLTFVFRVVLAAIGYARGPRISGTLGVVGIVAPVLLGLRWARQRRQQPPLSSRARRWFLL